MNDDLRPADLKRQRAQAVKTAMGVGLYCCGNFCGVYRLRSDWALIWIRNKEIAKLLAVWCWLPLACSALVSLYGAVV